MAGAIPALLRIVELDMAAEVCTRSGDAVKVTLLITEYGQSLVAFFHQLAFAYVQIIQCIQLGGFFNPVLDQGSGIIDVLEDKFLE